MEGGKRENEENEPKEREARRNSACVNRSKTDNVSVYTVLEKGLQDLESLCDVVIDKFSAARAEEQAKKASSGNATDAEMVDA
jgi:hypothetical protein